MMSMLVLHWELSHYPGHELAIHFKLLHHSNHIVWRWWVFRIATSTTTTTTWPNHPAKF